MTSPRSATSMTSAVVVAGSANATARGRLVDPPDQLVGPPDPADERDPPVGALVGDAQDRRQHPLGQHGHVEPGDRVLLVHHTGTRGQQVPPAVGVDPDLVPGGIGRVVDRLDGEGPLERGEERRARRARPGRRRRGGRPARSAGPPRARWPGSTRPPARCDARPPGRPQRTGGARPRRTACRSARSPRPGASPARRRRPPTTCGARRRPRTRTRARRR